MTSGVQHGAHAPPRTGAGFFRALVLRPVTLATLFVTILVVGVIAYVEVPVQMMPDGLVSPGLQVVLSNPGASAQENEEQVTRVLEDELRTLPRLEHVDSTSDTGSVGIFVSFASDTDMDFAKAEVRDRIERARPRLPKSVQDVGIWSWSESNLPVIFFALLHPGDSSRTDFLVDEVVKRRLEAVDGVGRVEVWGTLEDSLRILLDEDRVKAASLDLGALIRRLASDNFALPLGEVEDGGRRILLRSDMRFASKAEIEGYPIGGGLTIADVGRVESVKSVRERLFRIDGRQAYYGEVQKDGQSNTVDTCKRLQAAIAEIEKDPALRGEFEFMILFNQGEFIEGSMAALTSTALEGGIFAVAILFLFLWRVRLTLLVALSIPISALVAIAWTYFSGGSFNVLTMTGITLAMGMLVDNSIVVIENVTRLKQLGFSAFDASVRGTSEVALPVLLSTLTTVVVFLPLVFMSDDPELRILFGELGIPLCVSLLASLGAALVFLPVQALGSLGPRAPAVERWARRLAPIGALPARAAANLFASVRTRGSSLATGLAAIVRVLTRGLAAARVPVLVAFLASGAWTIWRALDGLGALRAARPFDLGPGVGVAPACLRAGFAGLVAVAAGFVAFRYAPRWHARARAFTPSRARAVPAGASIVGFVVESNRALVTWSLRRRGLATACAGLAIASIVIPAGNMKVAAFGQDESKSRVNFWVDLEENFTIAEAEIEMIRYEEFLEARRARYGFDRLGDRFGRTGGRLSLYWKTPQSREHLSAVRRDLESSLPRLAGHVLRFVDDEGDDRENRSVVSFRLKGPDSEVLARLGADAVRLLESVPGLEHLRSPLGDAPPLVRVRMQDDVAQRLGVTARDAFENISWALRGARLPNFQEPGREIPVLIEYDQAEVAGLATLRDLEVYTRDSPIPLSAFANLEFDRMTRSIDRHDGEASFTIQARIDDPSRQRDLTQRGRLMLATLDLPRGYSIDDEDSVTRRQDEELQTIWYALALSVVLVMLLMGVLFESLVLPASVFTTIPFAVVGAYWTLYATGTAMDSVGWIGIIILVGVVVNNGIVLIDCVHTLRASGMERTAAVIEGCGQRVRPILMTALTSVMGLLPMALSEPAGQSIDYRALATCVAGGLTVSTVFTLWVVPVTYTLIEDGSIALRGRWAWSLRPLSARRDPSAARSDPA